MTNDQEQFVGEPRVSVIIPTYNSEKYLPETFDTIDEQGISDLEILLIDDGSTDGTAEWAAGCARQMVYMRADNWGGPARPRNIGLQNARSPYVAMFDSDDTMLPNKLSEALDLLDQNPMVALTFTNFMVVDENGSTLLDNFLGGRYNDFRKDLSSGQQTNHYILPAGAAFHHLLAGNFVGTSSVVGRRDVLLKLGGFDEKMKNSDDVDMWRRIARSGHDFGFIDIVLHRYRRRAGGVTGRGHKRMPAVIYGLRKHLDAELPTDVRQVLKAKISGLELDYAAALRRNGEMQEARQVLSTMRDNPRPLRWYAERLKLAVSGLARRS